MPSFPMSNSVDAEYIPGSYHVYHQGTAYLNYDNTTFEPIIFTDKAEGALDENGQISVNVQFKRKLLMQKAKTISIKFRDGSTASYLEGDVKLSYKGDAYLLMDDPPILSERFPKLETVGIMEGTSIHVSTATGMRGKRYSIFEKEGDDSSKKRKIFDVESEEKYMKTLKKALVMEKKAPAAIELAQKALKSVEELIAFEKEACAEAGIEEDETVFEDYFKPFEGAITALSRVILHAKGNADESAESDE